MTRIFNILKRLSSILFYVTMALLVLVALFLMFNNLSGNGRTVFGNVTFARVATGSMEPELPTGSFILIACCDAEALQIGDTVTFWSDDPSVPDGFPVSHRLVRTEEQNGRRCFITKGIANDIEDPIPVYEDAVIGKVIWHSVVIGALIGFAQSAWVLPLLIGVLAVCLVFNVVSVIREAKNVSDESHRIAVEKAREEALKELREAEETNTSQTDL